MDWDDIFPIWTWTISDEVAQYDIDAINLKAHLIASWACIEDLQKKVQELQEFRYNLINRLDE